MVCLCVSVVGDVVIVLLMLVLMVWLCVRFWLVCMCVSMVFMVFIVVCFDVMLMGCVCVWCWMLGNI